MPSATSSSPFAVVAALSLSLAACQSKPVEQASCAQTDEGRVLACADSVTGLRCSKGTLSKMACANFDGCSTRVEGARPERCIPAVAEVGELCVPGPWDVCAADRQSTLECKGSGTSGKYERALPCRGPAGCTGNPGATSCDQTLSRVGDTCGLNSLPACTEEGALVICDWRTTKTYEVRDTCPTKKRCEVREEDGSTQGICDYGGSSVGSACGAQGLRICSADSSKVLECDGKAFAVSAECPKSEPCRGDVVKDEHYVKRLGCRAE